MNLNQYKNIYFIGIGGIGMSALARYFNNKEVNIFGYDQTSSDLCLQLEQEGMRIHYTEEINDLFSKEDTLIVYTPAIPESNLELTHFRKDNYTILKRSELLGKITENHFTIAVAGTHGKTTTSTMISHILHNSDIDTTAFLGGISSNYNSNVILGSENSIVVVEADEFDKSFLTLNPDIAIITSVDADHLDIYGTKENLLSTFTRFTDNIKRGGTLFLEENIDSTLVCREDIKLIKYSTKSTTNCTANNLQIKNNSISFDVKLMEKNITGFCLNMGGEYNVSNALAAISVSNLLDLDKDKIKEGVSSFKGIRRRFETQISNKNIVFIDDYAHHPKEISESITAVKKMYPNREVTVVFQPHLYSRTSYFIDEFASSLSLADNLLLLEIYAAREQKINGVSSSVLLEKCKNNQKELTDLISVVDVVKKKKIDVLLTLGAGDISTIVEPLKNILS